MPVAALIPVIGPLIDKALSFIPDPKEKARARAEMEQQILNSEQSFRDFVVAYEGRGDQVHPYVQIYRSSVRPTITYGLVIMMGFAIWDSDIDPKIIDLLFKLNLVTLAFWFGAKSLERLGINGKSMKGLSLKKRPNGDDK